MAKQRIKSQRKAEEEGLRYRRIVAKVGTNVLTAGTDRLNLEVMSALVGQVARLQKRGAVVLIVTSGASTAGRPRPASSSCRRRAGRPHAQRRGTRLHTRWPTLRLG